MPSLTAQNLINDINAKIKNYAAEAFHDMALNLILLRLVSWIDSTGIGGGTGGSSLTPLPVTSANFINATDCPLVSLAGKNLLIFWNDTNKFLTKGTDWTDLVGGGFKMIISGFDSTSATFTFYVFTTP